MKGFIKARFIEKVPWTFFEDEEASDTANGRRN
jgi:hypothetical protein